MSASVPSKPHFDVLVKAALNCNSHRRRFSWWLKDEEREWGGYRRELQVHAPAGMVALFPVPHEEGSVSPDELGSILLEECIRSVAHRYPDTGPGDRVGDAGLAAHGYEYTDPGFDPSPAQVFKAIDCLDYQSCEHDEWEESEAFAILAALRQSVGARMPGYEEAPWGWDERTLVRGGE